MWNLFKGSLKQQDVCQKAFEAKFDSTTCTVEVLYPKTDEKIQDNRKPILTAREAGKCPKK